MTAQNDIDARMADLEDIPGTLEFTGKRARAGYHMKHFAMSLMKEANRTRFRADERAYLDTWPLTDAQKQALLARDYNRCLELGGNIYFLVKLAATDGISVAHAVSSMTDMNFTDYARMMAEGGRSPDGVRSISANAAAQNGKA